jgi:hypothetical protein
MDSGNAHIAAMLGISSYALGRYTSFAGFHHSINATNKLVSDRICFPLPNIKVEGYEDAMRKLLLTLL